MNSTDRERARKRLDQLAWLTDNSIPIPGLNARVGIDPLIGLLPWVGDALGALLSSYIIMEAARLGAPRSVLLKMAFNTALDAVVGALPGLGDLFDFFWKANQRNLRLLERYLEKPRETVITSRLFVLVLGLLLVGFVMFMGMLGFLVVRALWLAVSGN